MRMSLTHQNNTTEIEFAQILAWHFVVKGLKKKKNGMRCEKVRELPKVYSAKQEILA